MLKEVDFTIKPGEKIGIVGRSGSGKTTLVNLISRFYDVETGRVLLDGVDVRELASGDLRRHVGVVLQEPFLFRGTICENLVYGRPEATAEEAITAARAAQAHDFILHKPLGYDTWLGERGAGLSGGERQRLSIARALIYDPKVLILDEATSSVDTESEKSIQEALKVLARGRTTIAIAHRLSHPPRLGPDLRLRPGPAGRAGHAQRADAPGRQVRQAGEDPDPDRPQHPVRGALNEAADETRGGARSESASELTEADFAPLWFEPDSIELSEGRYGTLEVTLADGTVHRSVFAVRCFPATRPDDFISLRTWDKEGHEHELGIVRNLDRWSARSQELIRSSLARRYFLRRIEGIDGITLEYGHLLFDVRTDQGPTKFTMRWTQSQAQDFGERGKVLLDTEDNRFLVPDVEALLPDERELFQRHVYW